MILIIAEKPSLGRNIAAGIGQMARRDGYLEGCGYIITWAFGHLFSLADIEAYTGSESSKWTMANLPCFPKEFKFEIRRDGDRKPDSGVMKQFGIIKSLCLRDDVDTVVNAGDADREGEIIVRLCVTNAFEGSPEAAAKKSFKRLWLPDQTPETVKQALGEMKDEREYDLLAGEGFARTYIDWLYGVNLTRYATLRSGSLLRVGRVIVPIVRAIYDRDMAIKNFTPEVYYAMLSRAETNGEVVELLSREKFDKNHKADAERMCALYNSLPATVTAVKRKKDTVSPGKLYSLSKLQNVLGRKFKMSMGQSLEIVQKLYEAGYLTYPRTNSEYLATAEKDKIKKIISNCKGMGYPVAFVDKKTIFDDSKIESHSALTPTYKIPEKSKLTEDEFKVYSTVFRRFIAVFCAEPCLAEKTEITVSVGDKEDFTLKGTVILEKGWMKYDDSATKDKILPKLNKGDTVNTDFQVTEKQTSPPKHYTIETLNNYLKNPFKEEKAAANADTTEEGSDEEEYRAIFEGLELGTEATRTGIIDNARKSEYIRLNKDVYTILPGGIYLIECIGRIGINMDKYKTAEVGRALKKVFHGNITVNDSVAIAENEIAGVFNKTSLPPEEDTDIGYQGDIVGKCPLCGGEVVRTRYSYSCKNFKETGCKFSVWWNICGRNISVSNMKLLLESGRTSKIKGFVSKNGKSFDAALKLEEGKAVFDFN